MTLEAPEIGYLSESPLNQVRYRKWFRKAFLFAALRTRSTAIREELAQLACGCSVAQLFELIQPELIAGQVQFDPYLAASPHRPAPALLRFRRRAEVRDCLFDLAWLLSNQEAVDSDANRAYELYSWLRLRFGGRAFSKMHRIDLALLSARLGKTTTRDSEMKLPSWTLADLLRHLPNRLPTIQVLAIAEALNAGFRRRRDWTIPARLLAHDLKNSWRTANVSDEAAWVKQLGRLLFPRGAAELLLSPADGTPALDRLRAQATQQNKRHGSEPLVSVVISCFEPSQFLFTAVRSVLAAAHQNLEVLVIDDASGKSFDSLLADIAALDARVRVLRQTKNGGTYRIRNRALDDARGDYITFHDSDDWMHPERISRQLSQLIKSGHPANISMSMRCSEQLEFAEASRRFRIGLCEPSLMFRRQEVVRKIGYFDSVRKGADSEYRQRLQRAYGVQLEVIEPFRVLTLQRGDNGGLTAGDLGYRWITEFRLAYRDAFQNWHRSKQRLFIEASEQRTFFAPRQMRFPSAVARAPREFDLVIAANFCDPLNLEHALALVAEAKAAKKSVGCWQVYAIYPLQLERSLGRKFLELLDSGEAATVYPQDEIQAQQLVLVAPSAYLTTHRPQEFAWQLGQLRIEPGPESWQQVSDAEDAKLRPLLRQDFGI